ncbi:DUF6588 family protein [uncultured Arcticibacterium sp.]|uniref:DUF6588 family protein n=1 Tax=uncultured Arcticibacterium sp. TaxID=2173042 RepID=UPI0030F54B2E
MKKTLPLLFLLCLSFRVKAQNFDDFLKAYEGQNQISYFQPLSDVLTAGLNSGHVDRMPLDSSFHFTIKLIGNRSYFITDKLRTFEPLDAEGQALGFQVPTIVGPSETVVIENQNGSADTYVPGSGSRFIPLVAPQITIGNFAGTSLSLRFAQYKGKESDDTFRWIGAGVQHNLGRYFLKNTNDFLVFNYAFQKLGMNNYFDFTTQRASIHAGKQAKLYHFYGFLGFQTGKLDADFEYEDSQDLTSQFNISLKNKNKLVGGVGAGLKLSVLIINAEVSLLQPTVVSANVGLSF